MRTIHKHTIKSEKAIIGEPFTISLPFKSNILTLQLQDKEPTFWYQCNPDNEKEKRLFVIYFTGWEIKENNIEYIGTWQSLGYVFHLYEIID